MRNSLQNMGESEVSFIGDNCVIFGMVASKENLISIINSPFVQSVSFDSLL